MNDEAQTYLQFNEGSIGQVQILRRLSSFGSHVDRMQRFAAEVASWSNCPIGRKHACILTLEGKYIISTGYNGTATKEPECVCEGKRKGWCMENCVAVHAEVNALANAARIGVSVLDSIAYVTKAPCLPCRAALKNSGVHVIIWDQANDSLSVPRDSFEALEDFGFYARG